MCWAGEAVSMGGSVSEEEASLSLQSGKPDVSKSPLFQQTEQSSRGWWFSNAAGGTGLWGLIPAHSCTHSVRWNCVPGSPESPPAPGSVPNTTLLAQ